MNKKKIHRAVLSLLAAVILAMSVMTPMLELPAAAVSQSQIDAKKAEQAALKQKIAEQQRKMNALKTEQSDILSQKEALDQQQDLKIQEINAVKEELELYRKMILEKEEEARIAQVHADEQLERYKQHIRSMEEQGMTNLYMQFLFSSQSISQLITRIDTVGEIMEFDKRIRDDYLAAKETALQAKLEYEAAVLELESKEVELQTEIDSLESELGVLQTELESLQSDIDGYASVMSQYAADEARINKEIKSMAEELKKQQTPPTATGNYIWPSGTSKTVTSKYGYRTHPIYGNKRFHAGVDIGAPMGSAIMAADGGTVIVSTYDGGYGNYVMLNHGDGRVTLYAHMSSRAASVGQTVTQGQVIGYVGSTGNSTGPHLHFEVRVNGGTVNPLKYFTGYTVG